MDLNDIRSAVTVLSLLVFSGMVAWACSSQRRAAFAAAAQLPFLDAAAQPPLVDVAAQLPFGAAVAQPPFLDAAPVGRQAAVTESNP